MKLNIVADYTIEDYPAGAEMVDDNISKGLGIDIIKTKDFVRVDPSEHYLVSNATMMLPLTKRTLMHFGNYSIFEHDYKIHPSRQPHKFIEKLFPREERINLDFFSKAKNVFVQSKDHLDCHKANTLDVKINYINLSTSIWSDEELDLLNSISEHSSIATYKYAIIDDKGPDKGTENAIAWCKANTLDYELIPKLPKNIFYRTLATYSTLVYIPNVKESFCRLVVEARALYMNVISPKTYGAVKEPWFSKTGIAMTSFLRENSKKNLETIKTLCQ